MDTLFVEESELLVLLNDIVPFIKKEYLRFFVVQKNRQNDIFPQLLDML